MIIKRLMWTMMFNTLSPARAASDLLTAVTDGGVVTMSVNMLSIDARPDAVIDALAGAMDGVAVGMLTDTMTSLDFVTIPT